jgi:tetratricopeptide (TPR) repeat protein
MLRKLIIFLLAASGIFCIVYGNSLNKPAETEPEVSETVDENEARYYELIDEAKSMQLDAADYRFYEAKQMFPDRPDAYAAEIQYYYDSQIPYTYENVTMIFEELGDNKIQLLTDFPKAGVITGKSYFMQGNYVEAASVLYTMLSVIDEPEPEIYLDYAIACCRMGDIERAQNTVQEYGKELPEDYALFIQAEVDRAQLKYKDAEAEYLEVIRLNQNTYNILEEAYLSLGEMYREYFQNALQTGEDQRIEDSMRKCVAMCLEAEKNANISYSIRLGQIRDFALYESKEFSYDEIGNAWKELIDNGLEEPRYYGNAIIAYRLAEQYDKASEIKDLYDQKYPNNPLDIY